MTFSVVSTLRKFQILDHLHFQVRYQLYSDSAIPDSVVDLRFLEEKGYRCKLENEPKSRASHLDSTFAHGCVLLIKNKRKKQGEWKRKNPSCNQ